MIFADGNGFNNPVSLKSINIGTSSSTTLVQAASTGVITDYINLPYTNSDGSITVFASNLDVNLTVTGETAEQIYSRQ